MGLKLITPPAAEPVSLSEAKEHLRITGTDEDALITTFIEAAREYCEEYQNRAYITQTWDLSLDEFPDSPYSLPKPPLQSISSIKYYDQDGTEDEFNASNYLVDTASVKGRVSLAYGKSWPSVGLQPMNGVIIQFIAGYGDAGSDVPERIRNAIKVLVGQIYENREATDIKEHLEVPFAVHALLGLDRIILS
jgi:uncharacterized phiE125 gp8 family phage protein